MTEYAKIITNDWQGKPVRLVEKDGTMYIPLIDISTVIGVQKRTLSTLLDRNFNEWEKYTQTFVLQTIRGDKPTRCITRDGAYELLLTVSIGHLKDDESRERLKTFRQHLIENQTGKPTLPASAQIKLPEQKLLPAPASPEADWVEHAQKHLAWADAFAKQTGADLGRARMIAMDAASRETGVNLNMYKYALPNIPTGQEQGYLTPTQIGVRISKYGGRQFTAYNVNHKLRNDGLQERDSFGEWIPTEAGKPYAKTIPWMRGSASGIQLLWHERIIEDLRLGL